MVPVGSLVDAVAVAERETHQGAQVGIVLADEHGLRGGCGFRMSHDGQGVANQRVARLIMMRNGELSFFSVRGSAPRGL